MSHELTADPEQASLLTPEEELAIAKASPDGCELSPAAQALYEREGAARFRKHHPTLWASMNQYQRADARMLVEGYRISQRHGESPEAFFERAKDECLVALDKRRAQVECMTFQDMFPNAKPSLT